MIFVSLVLILGCRNPSHFSLAANNQNQTIAFQPLDNYPSENLQIVANQIAAYFDRKVNILKPAAIPKTYFSPVVKMYAGDSIVQMLSRLRPDTIAEIIGVTNQPLYTMTDGDPMLYFNTGILGFSYQPGNACVGTDSDIEVKKTLSKDRLRNNILHEIGHNMGLEHCTDTKCSMMKRNTGDNYCEACRKKLMK